MGTQSTKLKAQNSKSVRLISYCFFIFAFTILCIQFTSNTAYGAWLGFGLESVEVTVNKDFSVDLLLDPEGGDINALELELSYDPTKLYFKSGPTGKSVVSIWLTPPVATEGLITMAGIMPGGFSGLIDIATGKKRAGNIASFVFRPLVVGTSTIEFETTKVIKNDGLGTELKLPAYNLVVRANQSAVGSVDIYEYNDTEPPDVFEPTLIKSKYIYDNKYTLIFNASDGGSGVERYEVSEGEDKFKNAKSPYLLEDQALEGIILVRAIDFAGNARTVALEPYSASNSGKWTGSQVLIVIAFVILLIVWMIRRKFQTHI